MTETIIQVLYRISQIEDDDIINNAVVFIKEPKTTQSPARIYFDKAHVGGWERDKGDYGFGDGMVFFYTVSYLKSFMNSDYTMEDVFNEVRNR